MLAKPALTDLPLHDLLRSRWSTRAFDAARPVATADLRTILEAARWAPSGNNSQPARYLVLDRQADAAAWQRGFDCLSSSNQAWCNAVPVLIMTCWGHLGDDNGRPNRWAQHDAGLGNMSLILQAVALGLAAHPMGGFDVAKAREAFSVPQNYTPVTMIAIGYQADPAVLDDDVKPKEFAPRSRKPLGEVCFAGAWGRGVT
jgi:nitroreductase